MSRGNTTSPYARFMQQRRRAKSRGVEWLLTFDEWFSIWEASGKYAQRGPHKGQYVMARKGDIGPYAVGNVFIHLHSDNVRDGYSNERNKDNRLRSLGTGRGWWFCKKQTNKPYVVSVCGKLIGSFPTQAEAEAAYQAKVAEIKAAA